METTTTDRVICRSGLEGWRKRLRDNYENDPDTWVFWSNLYSLAARLGYKTDKAAWDANPLIEGSVDPRDFRLVDGRLAWEYRGCKITPVIGEPKYFGSANFQPNMRNVQYRKRYWEVCFPDGSWIFCATKDDCRAYIDDPRNDWRGVTEKP